MIDFPGGPGLASRFARSRSFHSPQQEGEMPIVPSQRAFLFIRHSQVLVTTTRNVVLLVTLLCSNAWAQELPLLVARQGYGRLSGSGQLAVLGDQAGRLSAHSPSDLIWISLLQNDRN